MPPETPCSDSSDTPRVDELVQILRTVETQTTRTVVGSKTTTVRTQLEAGVEPETVTDTLSDAVAIAVEGDYPQSVIDTLMLAVERIDDQYSVPPENIPEDVLPANYPTDKFTTDQ